MSQGVFQPVGESQGWPPAAHDGPVLRFGGSGGSGATVPPHLIQHHCLLLDRPEAAHQHRGGAGEEAWQALRDRLLQEQGRQLAQWRVSCGGQKSSLVGNGLRPAALCLMLCLVLLSCWAAPPLYNGILVQSTVHQCSSFSAMHSSLHNRPSLLPFAARRTWTRCCRPPLSLPTCPRAC